MKLQRQQTWGRFYWYYVTVLVLLTLSALGTLIASGVFIGQRRVSPWFYQPAFANREHDFNPDKYRAYHLAGPIFCILFLIPEWILLLCGRSTPRYVVYLAGLSLIPQIITASLWWGCLGTDYRSKTCSASGYADGLDIPQLSLGLVAGSLAVINLAIAIAAEIKRKKLVQPVKVRRSSEQELFEKA